ncbi:MAG: futalosine hydrolase, partial [Bacteroidota bacterium]
ENEYPFKNRKLQPKESLFSLDNLKKVTGLTVQTVTGSLNSLSQLSAYYSCDIESMEGAAVFYVANQLNIPALQIRAISNYVEPRNRGNWKVQDALLSLSHVVKQLL